MYGWRPEQGTVTLAPGESRVFDLRAPPITQAGLWRIDKVEAEDTSGHWFELGGIGSHLMVGPQSLIKDRLATASSEKEGSGNGPQRANDGNMRTRWESEWKDEETLTFLLDSTQIVDTAIVRSEAAFPLWFDVLVQEEGGSEWILVVKDLRGLAENSTYISFSPHSARKIKFHFRERGTEWGHSIREIEVYNLLPMGGPLSTETPIPTLTPNPTPTTVPDTTKPEEVNLTSPSSGAYLGSGWFNATAHAVDYQSGVKKVEFHFWHDGAWHIIEDWGDADGWSASLDTTGFWAQNDMQVLVWVEDKAGNRVQSNVATNLSNVTPGCSLVWVPKSGSINSGSIELTANYNGWWRATIDGKPWTAFNVENGKATASVDLTIDPGKSVTYTVVMWFPYEGGASYCGTDVTVNNIPEPTSTPTETRVSTSTPTPTATPIPTPSVTDPMSGVIEGTIIDETGVPVRGVDVQLWRDSQPDVMYWSQWVEDGTYRFYGLPYSTWTVEIFNPTDDEYWKPVSPQIVKIDAQHLVHVINFTLVRNLPTKYQLFIPLVKR